MRAIIEPPPEPGETPGPLRSRLLWFAALWLGGAAATALVAYGLRMLLVRA